MIQIYLPDPRYLPFYLYANSLCHCIQKKITENVEIIHDLTQVKYQDTTTILFLFLIHMTQDIIVAQQRSPIKIVFINTEQYANYSTTINSILDYADQNPRFYLLEYNPKNMKYYRSKYHNLPIFYLPLLYSEFLETYYNELVPVKIPYEKKDIDIFFSGSMNTRRKNLLRVLQEKYRVKVVLFNEQMEHRELFQYMERSKMVLNVFYYDVFAFDFYRNALLLSNHIMLLSEFPRDIDLEIETNLIGYNKNLFLEKYDFIPTTTDKILQQQTPEAVKTAVNLGYEWFKQHNMSDYVVEFFSILDRPIKPISSIITQKPEPIRRFGLFS